MNFKSTRTTMDDVARRAGVSRTTVSFVLNDRNVSSIPESTRERIRQAVIDLGYRPNAGARALALNRTGLIGLITEIVTAPFATDVIKGAQQQAWSAGSALLIGASEGDAVKDAEAMNLMLEHRVEGLLFATAWNRVVELPADVHEVRTVLVHCSAPGSGMPSILPDEVAGGRIATECLIEAGHKRIGFINLDPIIPAAIGRRSGYEQALEDAGLGVDPELIREGDSTAEGGYLQAQQLLSLKDRPTAIFCANDRTAMGAYDAIKERGLRIPADIAVVGFDNQDLLAPYLRPALTTVALPFAKMGTLGVQLLSSDSSLDESSSLTVACPLVRRDSV